MNVKSLSGIIHCYSEDNDHTGCLNGQSLSATDLYRTWLTVQCINFDLTYIKWLNERIKFEYAK